MFLNAGNSEYKTWSQIKPCEQFMLASTFHSKKCKNILLIRKTYILNWITSPCKNRLQQAYLWCEYEFNKKSVHASISIRICIIAKRKPFQWTFRMKPIEWSMSWEGHSLPTAMMMISDFRNSGEYFAISSVFVLNWMIYTVTQASASCYSFKYLKKIIVLIELTI